MYRIGQFENALILFDSSFKVEPDNLHVLLRKGELLMELERYDEAKMTINTALMIDPENRIALNLMEKLRKL